MPYRGGGRIKLKHRILAITFEGKDVRGPNFHTFLALKKAQKRVKIGALYDNWFKSYDSFTKAGVQIL